MNCNFIETPLLMPSNLVIMCFLWYCSPCSCFGCFVCIGKALCSLIETKTSRLKARKTVTLWLSISHLIGLFKCFKFKWSVGVCLCMFRAAWYFPQCCNVWPASIQVAVGFEHCHQDASASSTLIQTCCLVSSLNTAALMFDFVFVCVRAGVF